ncbi:MAG: PqqD family protein, partial [Halobacteriota archaeon]
MTYFKLNESQVVFENYDDEVVLINLANGSYFSMNGVAAAIWAFVEKGTSIEQVIDGVATRYKGNREDIAASVESFLMTLSGEGLVLRMDSDASLSEPTQDP